jgi:hypothetical protein
MTRRAARCDAAIWLLWGKSGHCATIADRLVLTHRDTSAPSIDAVRKVYDHVVGAAEQSRRHGETQSLSGLEIDHQLEFCGLLDWQVDRLDALQDFLHEGGAEPKLIGTVDAVRQECADLGNGPRRSGDRMGTNLEIRSARGDNSYTHTLAAQPLEFVG